MVPPAQQAFHNSTPEPGEAPTSADPSREVRKKDTHGGFRRAPHGDAAYPQPIRVREGSSYQPLKSSIRAQVRGVKWWKKDRIPSSKCQVEKEAVLFFSRTQSQVRGIPFCIDRSILQCRENSTTGLMLMCAIAELTMRHEVAQFREVGIDLFGLCIP